jgi:hypothetical protein
MRWVASLDQAALGRGYLQGDDMTQAIDIISRALKDIGALEAGETPAPADAQDAFDMLNDMLDQWSNEQMMVFYKTEIIFTLTSGQTQYTIGPGGQIGGTITGSISGTTLTVTDVSDGAIALGMTMTGSGVAPGTKIVRFGSGAGGNVNSDGTYTVNISQTVGSTTLSAYYERPLNINSAFVRINTNENGQPVLNGGLDYPITILNLENYELIGFKTLNGPWPRALYYQPSETLGNDYGLAKPLPGRDAHLHRHHVSSGSPRSMTKLPSRRVTTWPCAGALRSDSCPCMEKPARRKFR